MTVCSDSQNLGSDYTNSSALLPKTMRSRRPASGGGVETCAIYAATRFTQEAT